MRVTRLRVAVLAALAVVGLLGVSPRRAAASEPPELHLVFPLDVTLARFRSTFGDPRVGHRHQGNDIYAPKHSPVFAAADGVVSAMRASGNAGRYLVITHEGGWETWYMHLNDDSPGTDDHRAPPDLTYAPGVRVGARVVAGQLVAYVGDSGNAEDSPSHTHFELHFRGRPVDPYPFLLEAFERGRVALLRSGPLRLV